MGCVLSAPVELIRVQRHGSSTYRCAVADMQGWRVGHEDAHEIKCDETSAALWVLDGHGGDGVALYSAPELVEEFKDVLQQSNGLLPSDERIEQGFAAVDSKARAYTTKDPSKESGSTCVGAFIAKQSNGTFTLKLMNCGDSRGLVIRSPFEEEDSCTQIPVRIPQHLEELGKDSQAIEAGHHYPAPPWPLVAESVDHKPSHPTEKGRIVAGGGHVSEEEPPRLDGNLAVSRGFGDFEYKSDSERTVAEQKVSVVPDIYEMAGLREGSICVLGCDGVWDVMTGEFVATFVRDKILNDPNIDFGEIAADIIRQALSKNSRDNVTVMICQLIDGSSFADVPDEMKNYEKLSEDSDEEVRKQYLAFLRKCQFPAEPCACSVCGKWMLNMQQCPCKTVYYCSRQCQKKGWKTHKISCAAKK